MMKRVLLMLLAVCCTTACGVKRDLKLPDKKQTEAASEASTKK